MSTIIKFPATCFKKLDNPNDVIGKRDYMMVVNIKRLPKEFDAWRKINPRDPKIKSHVTNQIMETLVDDPESFYFKNRGLTLLAKQVTFDNKAGAVEVVFQDDKLHGLLDGGHTYKTIMEYNQDIPESNKDKEIFVKMEIIEGISDRDEVVSLVESRNTSAQVRDVSLFELNGYFNPIKMVLSNEDYKSEISYKEYEVDTLGKKKEIPIQDILSMLICFDADEYDGGKHPVFTYSSKVAVLRYFEKNRERLDKFVPLLPKILKLWDTIYAEFPLATKIKPTSIPGAKVLKGNKVETLPFLGKDTNVNVPVSYIYPIFAAFRELVIETKDGVDFSKDPIKHFNEIKQDLVKKVLFAAKQHQNPMKTGKDTMLWANCTDIVHYTK